MDFELGRRAEGGHHGFVHFQPDLCLGLLPGVRRRAVSYRFYDEKSTFYKVSYYLTRN